MSLNNLEGNVVKKAHVHSQRILLTRILTKTTTIKITEHAPAEVLHNGHLCNVAATWTTRKKRCKMNLNSPYTSNPVDDLSLLVVFEYLRIQIPITSPSSSDIFALSEPLRFHRTFPFNF